MRVITILFIALLLITLVSPGAASLSITYTPAFEREGLVPVLLVSVMNTGNTVHNVSTFVNYSGIMTDKSTFMTDNYMFSKKLANGDKQYFQIPFKFIDSKDDITVITSIRYNETERTEIQFTIPAILVMNINMSDYKLKWGAYLVSGVIVSVMLIYIAKKRE